MGESTRGDFFVSYKLRDVVRYALKEFGFFGSALKYFEMALETRRFIKRPGASKSQIAERRKLVRKFRKIDQGVLCGHYPYQALLIAEYILGLDVAGPLVECGSFKGGSAAKLSLVAEMTGRDLYVCDSFQGLPAPSSDGEATLTGLVDTRYHLEFKAGDYSGTLEEVKNNIERFGCLEVCRFVPGFFEDSLPGLEITPAFVFTDVDLVSSARSCLEFLWPRLARHGLWFTHEAAFTEYVYGILDPRWWHDTLGECPPVMIGAGSGLSSLAAAIAYMKKL